MPLTSASLHVTESLLTATDLFLIVCLHATDLFFEASFYTITILNVATDLLLIASLVNNVLVSVVGGALRSMGVVGSESGEAGSEETEEDLCEVAVGGVAGDKLPEAEGGRNIAAFRFSFP